MDVGSNGSTRDGGYTFRHKTVLKDQFTCIAASHAELIELLMRRETGEALLNNECSYSL